MKKIIIYIDLDDTIFDYKGAVKKGRELKPEQPFPQSRTHFFYDLIPLEGAIDAVKWFFSQPNFECYFLSAPSAENTHCYTEKRLSLDKHFGSEIGIKLAIHPNKALNIGDYLIDDLTSGKGQEGFKGVLLQIGSERFPDWKSIVTFFEKNHPPL